MVNTGDSNNFLDFLMYVYRDYSDDTYNVNKFHEIRRIANQIIDRVGEKNNLLGVNKPIRNISLKCFDI